MAQVSNAIYTYISRVIATALPPAIGMLTTLVAIPLAHQSLPPGTIDVVVIVIAICNFIGTASPGASIALMYFSANRWTQNSEIKAAFSLNFQVSFIFLIFYINSGLIPVIFFILAPLITLAQTKRAVYEGRGEFWKSASLKLIAINLPPLLLLLWLLIGKDVSFSSESYIANTVISCLLLVFLWSILEAFRISNRAFLKIAASFASHGLYVICLYQIDKAFIIAYLTEESLSRYLYQADLAFKVVAIQSVFMAPFLPAMLSNNKVVSSIATFRAIICSAFFSIALAGAFYLSQALGVFDGISYQPLRELTESVTFLFGVIFLSMGALFQRILLAHQKKNETAIVFLTSSVVVTTLTLIALYAYREASAVVFVKGATEVVILICALLFLRYRERNRFNHKLS